MAMDEHVKEGHAPPDAGNGGRAHDPRTGGPVVKNNELPLSVQCLALSALWLTWLAALGYVMWREYWNKRTWTYFAHPEIVYGVLYGAIPAALWGIGWSFVMRIRPSKDLPLLLRYLILLFTLLTILAGIMFVAGFAACCMPTVRIRE
jgi:hypothetical protein